MSSTRHRVVITDFIDDSLEHERQILGDLADVEALNAFNERDLIGRVETADAIMLYHNLALTSETINRLERCKLIVRCGVGIDNVDRPLARSCGIPVANIPDYGTEEVADSAIGLTLALMRGIHRFNSRLQRNLGDWTFRQAAPLHRLRGQTFAVVGLGRIGTATALRAKALGMDVVFYDPYLPDGAEKALGVRRAWTLEDLVAQARVLSLHCPLTDETYHLINAAIIQAMPEGTFLVNTARGRVIDTSVLPAAIESGRLAGAGIDVLEHEPPDETDRLVAAWQDPEHPAFHRVIINPHAAFYSEEGLIDMRTKGSSACRNALLGLPIRNIVN